MTTARSSRWRRSRPHGRPTALLVLLSLLLAACGTSSAAEPAPAPTAFGDRAATLRLGYSPNVTHAAAAARRRRRHLPGGARRARSWRPALFDAGPAAIEALVGGGIDATFIGPSPAINSYVRPAGDTLRIVSGATANGASLVVQAPEITDPWTSSAATPSATPQLGGTQDVALRTWLLEHGLKVQINRRRRRRHRQPGELPDPRPVQDRRARRRLAAGAVGVAAGAGGRCRRRSWTRPHSGTAGVSRPRCSS